MFEKKYKSFVINYVTRKFVLHNYMQKKWPTKEMARKEKIAKRKTGARKKKERDALDTKTGKGNKHLSEIARHYPSWRAFT